MPGFSFVAVRPDVALSELPYALSRPEFSAQICGQIVEQLFRYFTFGHDDRAKAMSCHDDDNSKILHV